MLLEAIVKIPGWDTMSAEDLTSALNAKSVNKENHTLFTGKQLTKVLTPDEYRLVAGTIAQAASQDPLVADAQGWLRSEGLDFADPLTQAMLDQLAAMGDWPADVTARVKAVGVQQLTPYENEGGEGVVTVADVETELDVFRAKQRVTNAAALAEERTPETEQEWLQCWIDAGL